MLEVTNLTKSFGGVHAMRGVTLAFPKSSLTAIIGPNGAGKTTFFNLVSGHIVPDEGRVVFAGRDIAGHASTEIARMGLCRAFQVASLFQGLTVAESLAAAVASARGETWSLFRRFPSAEAERRAGEIMALTGLEGRADDLARNLPHGEQKLLDIALALALDPKVLLLDEPTAGMGAEERWQMIDKVKALWEATDLTVVFIEHDMDIVFSIAQQIHVLKYGQVLASGTADEIRANEEVIDAYLGTDHFLDEAEQIEA
jgi:branched-chain amino acid transport system ATP-binding protein